MVSIPVTLDELIKRFGSGSPEREIEIQEVVQFIEWAQRAGVRRIIVNGSFVTEKVSPNDVDIVILPSAEYPRGEQSISDQEMLWPYLQIFVADDDVDLHAWALEDFGTDREDKKKGVVEVIL
jgi:hypothetical protein